MSGNHETELRNMGYIAELRALVGHRPLVMTSAGALIIDDQNRLLMQKRSDNNLWGLPGGSLEPGETFEDAARREVREETGLEAGAMTLFGLFSGSQFFYEYPNGDQIFNAAAVYLCRETSGALRLDADESTELRFFDLRDLPTDLNPLDAPIVQSFLDSQNGQMKTDGAPSD